MGALVYDLASGFVYASGDAEDPQNPEWGYINPFNGDFLTPPVWFPGISQWYWQSDGDVHWYQEGTPEPQKPFDMDDAEQWLEDLQADAEACEADRADLRADMIAADSAFASIVSDLQASVAALQVVPVRSLSSGFIQGLTWEYDPSDTSRILFKAGRSRSDDDTFDMRLQNDMFVDLDVVGAGGIDTGSKAANSVYWI